MLTTINNKKVFVGDGSTTVFYYDFEVLKAEDIKCIVIDTDGNETELVYQTDYTVDLTNSSVSLSTPLRNGYTLVVYREVNLTQETEYPENSPFPAKSHEKALDKLTMITQQLAEKIDRAIVKNIGESGKITVDPLKPNKALVVNEDGSKIIMGPNANEISNAQTYAEVASDAAEVASDAAEVASDAAEVVNSKILACGFDLDNPETMGVLSFDTATRTLSINPVSGQNKFTFWVKNVKYEKENDSIILPDASGLYYIYYDENGVIQQINANNITDKHIFFKNTLVATIYRDVINHQAIVSDSRYGIKMDTDTRANILLTEGIKYYEGLNLNGLSDNSITYNEISSGSVYIGDRLFKNNNATTQHKFLYRLYNQWVVSDIANNKLAFKDHFAEYYQYNYYDYEHHRWELVEMHDPFKDVFCIMFIVAVPNVNGGLNFYKILGQHAYTEKSNIKDAILTELQELEAYGLPFDMYIMLYAYLVDGYGHLVSFNDGSLFYDFRNLLKGVDKVEYILNANDLLDKIKQVDGVNSGLDADTLDGLDSSQFLRRDTSNYPTQNNKFDLGNATYKWKNVYATTFQGTATNADKLDGHDSSYFADSSLSNVSNSTILDKIKQVDGSGSGLDADTLDGHDSSYFAKNDLTNVDDNVILNKLKQVDGVNSGLDADLLRGLPADFTCSKSESGYTKLPNGIIIQWIKIEISNAQEDDVLTFSFPIAFPNDCLRVIVGSEYGRVHYNAGAMVSYNKTSFSIKIKWSVVYNNSVWSAVAIGY